jgi:hypothetical protein
MQRCWSRGGQGGYYPPPQLTLFQLGEMGGRLCPPHYYSPPPQIFEPWGVSAVCTYANVALKNTLALLLEKFRHFARIQKSNK